MIPGCVLDWGREYKQGKLNKQYMDSLRGKLVDSTLHSYELNKEMRLHLYLPPGYDSDSTQSYPVLYLLHAWGVDEYYWCEELAFHRAADLLIAAGTVPPFIAVMPQGDKSYFIDAADPGGDYSMIVRLNPDQYSDALNGYGDYGAYMLTEMIPAIRDRYHVRTDRGGQVIAGIGMGATGASVLAFTNPDTFGGVGIHSPTLFDEHELGPPWIFGLGDAEAFAQRDPLHLARNLKPDNAPRVFLDCGADDDIVERVRDLHQTLDWCGIQHTFACRAGKHHTAYWQKHLARYIGFYSAGW